MHICTIYASEPGQGKAGRTSGGQHFSFGQITELPIWVTLLVCLQSGKVLNRIYLNNRWSGSSCTKIHSSKGEEQLAVQQLFSHVYTTAVPNSIDVSAQKKRKSIFKVIAFITNACKKRTYESVVLLTKRNNKNTRLKFNLLSISTITVSKKQSLKKCPKCWAPPPQHPREETSLNSQRNKEKARRDWALCILGERVGHGYRKCSLPRSHQITLQKRPRASPPYPI